jgi:signal transduction histidine kinase
LTTGEPVKGQAARFDVTWAEGQAPDERYVDFVYQPLREEDNSISGIIVLGVDVTENKRAQKALIQNEKLAAVGRLSASIAHEINNPLGAVTNLLYLAGLASSMGEVQDYLHRADSELRRISAITNQTLSFSKQSAMKTVDGAELLGGVINVFQSRLLNGRVRVEQRVRSHDPIRCCEGEIRQVLSNLVSNAIESMQSLGRTAAFAEPMRDELVERKKRSDYYGRGHRDRHSPGCSEKDIRAFLYDQRTSGTWTRTIGEPRHRHSP